METRANLHSALLAPEIFSREFDVRIDRPIGCRHEKNGKVLNYTVNYGEIPEIMGGDGEPQDVYVLGVKEPLKTFHGRIYAILHRLNDVEDKWVAWPEGMSFTSEEIRAAVDFQEKYYSDALIYPLPPKD